MRVLIVEDQRGMAVMLKRAFDEKGHLTSIALNGNDGVVLTNEGDFDVIVLDLMLPDRDGLEIVRELRANNDRTPILILTAKDTIADMVTLLDAGADDYLTKPFALAELFARVRAVARRGPIEQPVVLRVGDLTLDPSTGQVDRGGQKIQLTRTERLLLEVLLRHRGRPVPRGVILEAVWGSEADTSLNTLEAFVKLLRAKVDDPYERKLIQTVRGVGYRLCEEGGS
jgi:two-component system OmpR family response regulator